MEIAPSGEQIYMLQVISSPQQLGDLILPSQLGHFAI